MLNVGCVCAVAVKFKFVTSAPEIVTLWLSGANVNPGWLGGAGYWPFAKPVKVYAPELFAVVVAVAAPVSVTVAPPPPVEGLIVPEMLKTGPGWAVAVKFSPETLAPDMVAL